MKKINVSDLQPGTKYDKPVYIDGEHLLVPEGVTIRQKDIDRLNKWGFETVLTEGELITELSTLEGVAENIGNILDQKGGESDLTKTYRQSVVHMDRIFGEVKVNRGFDRSEVDTIVSQIFEKVGNHENEMIALVLRSDRSEPSLGKSSVDCTILALVLGKNIGLDDKRLYILATAACLHDIGMVRIPDSIVQKKSNLSPEELKRMRTHTVHSYKIISKDLGYSEEVGLAVFQHHERWDGKGYPRQLSGKKIALEARILTVADAFEAMIKEKPYRNSMIGYKAMRQLLNDNSRRFDSEILKVFIKAVGIYPLGSFVLLNNGAIGRVIKINRSAPLRPAVRILVDAEGNRHLNNDGPLLDLANNKDVFIAKAIDPKAIGAKKTM